MTSTPLWQCRDRRESIGRGTDSLALRGGVDAQLFIPRGASVLLFRYIFIFFITIFIKSVCVEKHSAFRQHIATAERSEPLG